MVSVKDVVDAQAHVGTLKSEAHPKTRKCWAEVAKGVVIIDPESIVKQIESAQKKVQKAKADGKSILVVCEKKMYSSELAKLGEKYGVSYLNAKVPAGFLTNFNTLQKRIESMNTMSKFMETEGFQNLTKKEQLVYKRKLTRVLKIYGGVKDLKVRPDLVIIVDAQMMSSLINELERQVNMDSILMVGTNFSRWLKEDGMIVSNIVSYKSLDFILNSILS